jgi:hypothetical protein
MAGFTTLASGLTEAPAVRHMRAWLLLVLVLALHVADEALTGFLDVYNPLAVSLRERLPWLPAPTFTFGVWLAGLILAVLALGALAPLVRRGATGMHLASWLFSAIMFFNGVGHLGGSVYFRDWLPGATTAPLLLIASALLARATWQRQCVVPGVAR